MKLVNAKRDEYVENEIIKAEVSKELEEDEAINEIVNEDDGDNTEPLSYEERIKSKFNAAYSDLNGENE